MWEFPTLDSRLRAPTTAEVPDLAAELRAYLAERGVAARALTHLGAVRHGITTRRITCQIFRARLGPDSSRTSERDAHPGTVLAPVTDRGWFDRARLAELPVAAATTKILRLLQESTPRLDF
jgi:hypothetical protein